MVYSDRIFKVWTFIAWCVGVVLRSIIGENNGKQESTEVRVEILSAGNARGKENTCNREKRQEIIQKKYTSYGKVIL